MPKTLITIATYNEIENLPRLVDEIYAAAPEAHLLVIDDNSPDGTGQWCDEKSQREAGFFCLHRAGKLGLGTAIMAGMQYGVEHGYDYVLNMDADFSHSPKYIPNLIAGMDPITDTTTASSPVDVMIGSRYIPGGAVENWPWRRRLMSKGVNVYARVCLKLSPRDCSGGFRCYRTSLLKQLDFTTIRSRGYSFQEEILWRLKRLGARFGETPIVFADRARGQSKINLREASSALRVIFRCGLTSWFGGV